VASFGHWLERHITRMNTNVVGLAGKVGVSHATISKWIAGSMMPSVGNIRRLANVLSVPVEEVYIALGIIKPREDLTDDQREFLYLLDNVSVDVRRAQKRFLRELVQSPGYAADADIPDTPAKAPERAPPTPDPQ